MAKSKTLMKGQTKAQFFSEEDDEVQEEDIKRMQRQINRSKFTIFPDSNFK